MLPGAALVLVGGLGEVTVGGTGPCYLILALLSPLLAFLQS